MDRRHFLGALGALGVFPATGEGLAPALDEAAGRVRGTTSANAAQSAVEVVVLGIAQDAGVPQVNCFKDHCIRVRRGEVEAPRVSCLGIVDHAAGRRFLIDATPDFASQVGSLMMLDGEPPQDARGRTAPLHEFLHGIFLTHAHMGHYTGLVHVGKEGAAPHRIPVHGTRQMADYLSANAPWRALVEGENIELRTPAAGTRLQLTEALAITPFDVVHRAEYTDTFGYLIHGPERTVMYVPDADVWDGWPVPFETLLERSDVALIDGSFWSYEELGHRVAADIPHPPVSTTIERLSGRDGLPAIRFIHLNHTNPLWDPEAPQHASLQPPFGLARAGERIAL